VASRVASYVAACVAARVASYVAARVAARVAASVASYVASRVASSVAARESFLLFFLNHILLPQIRQQILIQKETVQKQSYDQAAGLD